MAAPEAPDRVSENCMMKTVEPICTFVVKWNEYTFKECNSVKMFLFPSGKGSTLKGENLILGFRANSFLLEQTPFQKGIGVQVACCYNHQTGNVKSYG